VGGIRHLTEVPHSAIKPLFQESIQHPESGPVFPLIKTYVKGKHGRLAETA